MGSTGEKQTEVTNTRVGGPKKSQEQGHSLQHGGTKSQENQWAAQAGATRRRAEIGVLARHPRGGARQGYDVGKWDSEGQTKYTY